MNVIETKRLILRTWEEEDTQPFFDINQDPHVLEFLPGPLWMEEVIVFIKRMNEQAEQYRYTLWAVEEKEAGKLIGFTGLNKVGFEAHFTPAVEIGWRLGSHYWGKGYATEAAKAALDYGFNIIGLEEIVSFTVPENKRSMRVMEKIGMVHDPKGDFNHPKLNPDHPLSKHVLYRIKK